ncbi:MAG: hypothetical protein methR_P2244 [Methyloprofundus sp.]|nr:MAG: hypothetical protein methR_P2244 [Methyloprofundus sp.]
MPLHEYPPIKLDCLDILENYFLYAIFFADKIKQPAPPHFINLADPKAMASTLNDFFGGELDEVAMIKAVDPQLRRQGS